MSGVMILGELLRAYEPLRALIPADEADDRIKGGRLPDSVKLTALLIRTVSVVERQPLKVGSLIRTVERVSVAVRATNYRDQRVAIRLIRSAARGKVGALSGFANVSIFTAGTGPDLSGPGDSYEQTQDFRVSFDAAA